MSKARLKMRMCVKRILSVFLTLMLVQVGVPFTRFTVSAINDDLQGLIDSIQGDGAIEIYSTIYITKPLKIRGKNITLSGKGSLVRNSDNGSIIKIESTKESTGKLTMKGVVIDGNRLKAKSEAVSVGKNCEFIMESGEIINNYNNNTNGGGICNYGGDVTINGETVIIKGNTAKGYGGGIFNYEGTVTINKGTLSENSAVNSGGSICNYGGTVTINGGTINENTATNTGGGIYNYEGDLTINEGTISESSAIFGGSIYNEEGDVTINGGTISGNKASESGGGIYCGYDGTITMNGGTINENTATNTGGGIYNDAYGILTINDGKINGNKADGDGGGVYNTSGTVIINEGTINGNRSNHYGGGICCSYDGTITISGGTISGNTATESGGVYVDEGNKLNIKGTPKIIDNGENKNDNVRFASGDDYITIEGEFTGQIGVKQAFNKKVVRPANGYVITKDDLSHFKADSADAYLTLIGNEIIYRKNKTEWGKMVQIDGATYYVNENGRASAEIIGNAEAWLNTKIDGSGSWCGIDNSKGVFKTGSRFYFQVIDDANVGKYYDRIRKKYREKIESGKLKVFLIGVTDPDGNEYTTLDSDLTCYVKIDPNWDKNKLRAIFINGEKTEDVKFNCIGIKKGLSNDGLYAQLVLKHFSPYAIYQEKSQEAEIVQESSNDISVADNFATGDSIEYVYILGLWAASVIALAGIVVAKRKFNK